jgi:hypothetical protein
MANFEIEEPDPPACPLLGLFADRRSHFTYPHPGHRCFAGEHPATTDARRQATYCLSLDYTACDQYEVVRRPVHAGEGPEPRPRAPEAVGHAFRVHVFRAGESLAGIAAAHGLTADQIAKANGLALNDVVADGARLVIPLSPATRSYGPDP